MLRWSAKKKKGNDESVENKFYTSEILVDVFHIKTTFFQIKLEILQKG